MAELMTREVCGRCDACIAQRTLPRPGKRNVPPFKGGTRDYLMPGKTGVNAARKASGNAESVVLRCRFCGISPRNMWKRVGGLLRGSHAIL